MATDLDYTKYDVELVSPRNHFLFTPLLPSTAVGTLEFRAIQEPVRTIPNLVYHQASAESIDLKTSKVTCIDAFSTGYHFDIKYDALILAPGCESATFGIPGIIGNERVYFLKQLKDARNIRNRLIDCFERASSNACTEEERERLLTFIVVGGGPTNVEFASELFDFLDKDVSHWYPELREKFHIFLVEASEQILGTFHARIGDYVKDLFKKRRINIMTNTAVARIDESTVVFANGEKLNFGLLVWSTGVQQIQLIKDLGKDLGDGEAVAKFPNCRLKVDGHLRLQENSLLTSTPEGDTSDNTIITLQNSKVFAMGDCAANKDHPLPTLAQVASQQAIYLAKVLNKYGLDEVWTAKVMSSYLDTGSPVIAPFKYQHLGSMANVGEWKGVYDSGVTLKSQKKLPPVTGIIAYLLYKAAYWTRQVSIQNKILIPMYWFKSRVFGRDISRF
eukprot:CAMPEP_0172419464 /NCGR_PEP_ID=MMETSP1064-20121228/5902_1 /TAXON_ID=202472 /ORGANISM="Aulacoseira subarctica , Strain CCAP 1002/5" /LENGTH=447 /DNA_ID=CAMNT_0013158965 /DNA_START=222 /DNA_END=1565 /DNA_ORIENTATION=-